MANNLKLLKKFTIKLSILPENGMGYQIVDILLKNGNKLKRRVILNSTFLKLLENEKIENKEIKEIKLTKEK